MKAAPGNWLIVESTHLNEHKRHGLILEVHGPGGEPPYLVRWSDTGTESFFIPGPGTHILTAEELNPLHDHAG
ncbi:DUF1918 domain-containing protein [Kribbella sindirgiensis]|uniref:DUF1918 domain-containing protein n=1 Tax=Kribbella sindirgiensis TaxID=1124744 RepID=A0A4R0ID86_9ACTN|nr:DUF1918 domain-containing protein [Kribbella sindirgiensis]TCC21599.1 DUF1918 domain-containing protein [Kribbella sindirgiensis]